MSVLTEKTVELFQSAIVKHKSGGETFCKAYESALSDLGGKHWRTLPPDDLTKVVQRVRLVTYKLAVNELGLERSVFNRYVGGARRKILFGLPFKFALGASLTDCRRAIALAAEDTEGTHQERMQRAIDAINAERNEQRAASVLTNHKGGTYLAPPSADQTPKMNAQSLLTAIAEHLSKLELAKVLHGKNNSSERLRQILTIANHATIVAVA